MLSFTFCVRLDKNVCQRFDLACCLKGDIIGLWAALNKRTLNAVALDLDSEPRAECHLESRKESTNTMSLGSARY
jgi:hypothetical protein